jgi:hypothetical protein
MPMKSNGICKITDRIDSVCPTGYLQIFSTSPTGLLITNRIPWSTEMISVIRIDSRTDRTSEEVRRGLFEHASLYSSKKERKKKSCYPDDITACLHQLAARLGQQIPTLVQRTSQLLTLNNSESIALPNTSACHSTLIHGANSIFQHQSFVQQISAAWIGNYS